MRVPISSLPQANALTGAELIPVVQDGQTKRTTTDAIPYVPAGTGAVTTTVQSKLRETVSVKDFGADPTGVADSTAAIQDAIDSIFSGEVLFPPGSYKVSAKIRVNKSGVNLIGAGTDATYIVPTSDITTTAIEINNGSWNDVTEVYVDTGASIGSSSIKDLSLSGHATTSCTGVVFARATKQCHLTRVKVVGFSVGARMYGSWYAKVNHCTFESNGIGMYADYETNDFVLFECEFTGNTIGHLEFQGNANCRKITISGGSFDGMPSQWGAYFKTIQDLTIRDTYVEVYASPATPTASFFLFGQNTNSITIADNLFIAPSDTSYTGTFLDMGAGTGVGANYATITGNQQYQASACTFIDTTDSKNVSIGNNQSNAPSIIAIGEIVPSYESTISFPQLTGTTESRLTVCHTKKPFNIPRVRITFNASANLGTGEIRIIRQDTNTVVLNKVLGSVVANIPIDVGAINAMSPGVPLQAYIYKVGGSIDFPACSVTIEQV